MSGLRQFSVSLTICAALAGGLPAAARAALDPRLPLRKYVIDTWSTEDGLPNATIEAILQTGDGYLWLGTRGGLARFDGVDFDVFDRASVPGFLSNRVAVLHEDRRGDLWAGFLQGGLHRLHHGRWDSFDTRHGLRNNSVTAIYEDPEGTLWIGHDLGVDRLTRDASGGFDFERVGGCPEGVRAITRTGEQMWVLGNRELMQLADEACRWPEESGLRRLPEARSVDYWTSLLAARDGSLWLGTADGRILRFDGTHLKVMTVLAGKIRRDTRITSIYEDGSGTIWAGSFNNLVRFAAGVVSVFDETDGLSDRRPLAFFEDQEESLWIGTYNGLDRFKSSRFETLTAADGLPSDLAYVILEDTRGGVWIGTQNGIVRYADGAFLEVPLEGGLRGTVLAFLEDSKGGFWAGTSAGLYALKDGVLRPYRRDDQLRTADVRALYETRAGEIWVGTESTVFRLGDDGAVAEEVALDGWAVTDVYQDRRGDLWVSTEKRLYRRRGQQLEAFPPRQDARTFFIRGIREDEDGVFWLATVDSGLLRFKDERFTPLTTADGLYDDHVWYSAEDDAGTIWMCSDRGIFTADAREIDAWLEGLRPKVHSMSYGLTDGLKNLECNGVGDPAGLHRADGTVWFVTSGGVVIVDPTHLERNSMAPHVFVEGVRVDGRSIPVTDLDDEALHVPHSSRQVEIHFTATSFRDPARVRFRYRLEDYERRWQEASTRRFAVYGELPPGEYRFRVLASNNDGVWNEEGATLRLVVPTPRWRTWWAVTCYVLVLGLGVSAWVRSQRAELRRERAASERLREFDRNLRRSNAELARFNYTLSHDLKNEVTTITNYLGLARRDAEKGHGEHLRRDFDRLDAASAKLRHLIDDLLKLTSVGIEIRSPQEVAFGELVEGARVKLSALIERRDAEITVHAPLPTVHGDRRLLEEVPLQLIENALRHAGARPRIEIGVRNGTFYVRDHGKGIDSSYHERIFGFFERLDTDDKEGTGMGLPLVRRVVEFHGGRAWVESEGRGHGSTFCFTLPQTP